MTYREEEKTMISVGFSRNDRGQPVMLEKAYPDSERLFYEDGPSLAEDCRQAGLIIFFDGIPGSQHEPQRRYSHSSGDL
jgi:hypothetical protein